MPKHEDSGVFLNHVHRLVKRFLVQLEFTDVCERVYLRTIKALGKPENIVAETKFASQEGKTFPINSETFLLRKQCFPVWPIELHMSPVQ